MDSDYIDIARRLRRCELSYDGVANGVREDVGDGVEAGFSGADAGTHLSNAGTSHQDVRRWGAALLKRPTIHEGCWPKCLDVGFRLPCDNRTAWEGAAMHASQPWHHAQHTCIAVERKDSGQSDAVAQIFMRRKICRGAYVLRKDCGHTRRGPLPPSSVDFGRPANCSRCPERWLSKFASKCVRPGVKRSR